MLTRVEIRGFKSIESLEISLGVINVLIGANGSGKSNILEAIGVLSAAASGRVDDESLLRRGVRPGLPQLYKTAFARTRLPPHIFFGAQNDTALYEVSLFNPSRKPKPAWGYHTEKWESNGRRLVGRSHNTREKSNPEAGLAALAAVNESPDDSATRLLASLRDFAIFAPNTPTLRGVTADQQSRQPVGLSGGGLPVAVRSLLRSRRRRPLAKQVCRDVLAMIDWAKSYSAAPATKVPLSPSATSTKHVIQFQDRFMAEDKNLLSAYDASEGALYVMFVAALLASENSPLLFAIDNVDHGLNPRLMKVLMKRVCEWTLTSNEPRQVLLTTHNPLALDGLMLQDERIRLFTVARSSSGRTIATRVLLTKRLEKLVKKNWSLSQLWVMGHLGGIANV
jgi:energy-coupling factor transporter ATP-binding protein EcfA2